MINEFSLIFFEKTFFILCELVMEKKRISFCIFSFCRGFGFINLFMDMMNCIIMVMSTHKPGRPFPGLYLEYHLCLLSLELSMLLWLGVVPVAR